jgi:hypothetical protein
VGKKGRCLRGIRRTSLLYKVVSLEAVLFSGLFAGFAVTKGCPVEERPDGRWIAGAIAGVVLGPYILLAGITGELRLIGF